MLNNVETLAAAPVILERGAEWWRAQGVNGGEGLTFLSVSGHVERPGVFCVPGGTTVGEAVAEAGSALGAGAMVVLAEGLERGGAVAGPR